MSSQRRRRPRGRGPQRVNRKAETVTITHLAAQGDGEGALSDGTRVFVPFVLPGDRVTVEPTAKRGDGFVGRILEFQSKQPRRDSICDVYGKCGGCQLQHAPAAQYSDWKREKVQSALDRQCIDIEIAPLESVPLQSRRRATLAFVKTASGPVLGFHAGQSAHVVEIQNCPLLVPEIDRLIAPAAALLERVLDAGHKIDLFIQHVDGATEVGLLGDVALDLDVREALAEFANRYEVARVFAKASDLPPEPILMRRDVKISFSSIDIEVPPGGFLQPSDAGQHMLQKLVKEGVADATTIADLYAGIGTFSVGLATEKRKVHAVEGEAPSMTALSKAAGRHGIGGYLTTEVRDLRAAPVPTEDLSRYQAVIFDPPRAGAKPQADALSRSDVARVVAVSCNPSTMARDLRILQDGGYLIEKITPIDQFPMSHHVEAVAVLSKS